jgi:creatinine amidohydrolase
VAAAYWQLASRELASQRFMKTRAITHACEYETSMMLALRTDWVKLRLARADNQTRGSKYYDPTDEFGSTRLSVAESFHQLTRTGAMGSPELGTARKGRMLLDLIVPVVVDALRDFSRWKHPRKQSQTP